MISSPILLLVTLGLQAVPSDLIRFENGRVVAEIDSRRAMLTRLELKTTDSDSVGGVRLNQEDHPGASWRLWCHADGQRHTVLGTINTLEGRGIQKSEKIVTIKTRFGRSDDSLLPIHMEVSYAPDERGIWMAAKLSTEVPVRIEQLEYITFFHFLGDPQRKSGRAFLAPGWSDAFKDLEPQRKKCPGNSSSKYFYSAPWLDRRAMGWSWKGNGVWTIFPNACAMRGRFQKDIGVFYHFDSQRRGPSFNTHYITLQVEAQHHYEGCEWYSPPRNPFGVQESRDITVRPGEWTLKPGEEKYYGPYLIALTDSQGPDEDDTGYRQACAWGEELRTTWPPKWFPLELVPVRFALQVPELRDGQHYSLVLYNQHYWFSAETKKSGALSVRVFPGQPYRAVLVRTDAKLTRFEVLRRLFDGKEESLDGDRLYEIDLR